MKTLLMVFLLLMASVSSQASDKGNGGDSDAQWTKDTLNAIFQKLKKAYGASLAIEEKVISIDKVLNQLPTLEVKVVEGPIYVEGYPVEARNFPSKNLIEIDKLKFQDAHKMRLIIHEMLGLVGLEDSTYGISSKLEKIYTYGLGNFPFNSVFQAVHQRWSSARFASVEEAAAFIEGRYFKCRWVSWARAGFAIKADPNTWSSRSDVYPVVQKTYDPATGDLISIGMNTHFAQVKGGISYMENGKVTTDFNGGYRNKMKASLGRIGEVLFLKAEDTAWMEPEYATINVCETVN